MLPVVSLWDLSDFLMRSDLTVLYKYMPYRLEFFDDPLLRLTPPLSLNDPFDSKPSVPAIEKKTAAFFDMGSTIMVSEYELKTYRRSLEGGLDKYGVVSLSEDPYSLLMWSHYANEHRGVVVSISADESTFNYHGPFSGVCGASSKLPNKISYSSRRPGFEMPDEAISDIFDDSFLSHISLVKGDDWIYEKEYRYLIGLEEVDVAIFKLTAGTKISNLNSSGVLFQRINEDQYKVQSDKAETAPYLIWWLAFAQGKKHITDVMSFKRLQKESLLKIYFGCRVADEEIYESSRRICESVNFNANVNFYKARQSLDRFEIVFESLGSAKSIYDAGR